MRFKRLYDKITTTEIKVYQWTIGLIKKGGRYESKISCRDNKSRVGGS